MTDDRILEWLGFKQGEFNTLLDPEGVLVEVYPQGGKPTIGLDFLFEYALLKLKEELNEIKLAAFMVDWLQDILYNDKDPVVAFKQASIKLIGSVVAE